MSKYLITGAAGFIAARISQMLLEQGHIVVGVDNLNPSYDVRLKHYRLQQLQKYPNFHFHLMDVSNREIIDFLSSQAPFAAVFHLGARAGVRASVENPWEFISTNTTGTLNMLELCQKNSIPKFLLASTSSIYGANAPLPTPESASSDLPLQPYSASKKGAESMCHAYHYLYDIDVTIFRFFTVYGPAGRPDMVMFRFCQWIAEGLPVHLNGDGEQSRGFTYVDDIARGAILGLKPVGYQVINLGGHEVITMNQMIARLEEILGKKANIIHHPAHKADMLTSLADISKARSFLGWEPQVTLQEGMHKLCDWYLQERSWAKDVVTD